MDKDESLHSVIDDLMEALADKQSAVRILEEENERLRDVLDSILKDARDALR